MIASAAFGVSTAIAIWVRPAPPSPTPVAAPLAGAPATVATAPIPVVTAPTTNEFAEPPTNPAAPAIKPPVAISGPKATATAANPGRALDLHALTQGAPNVTPTDDPGTEAPKAAGQNLTEAQVRQVMALHQVAIGRVCWDRNPTAKSVVNVNVTLTVGPDGNAQ